MELLDKLSSRALNGIKIAWIVLLLDFANLGWKILESVLYL